MDGLGWVPIVSRFKEWNGRNIFFLPLAQNPSGFIGDPKDLVLRVTISALELQRPRFLSRDRPFLFRRAREPLRPSSAGTYPERIAVTALALIEFSKCGLNKRTGFDELTKLAM